MSDTSLVAAKKEYTQQLCYILHPLIEAGFKSIWKSCKENANKKSLKCFQEKISSVPVWNQNVIDNEYNRIIKETDCIWLDKLIEAVFLSNVKVLSTVRIGKIKTINIKIPETKKFLHKCYIESARSLWQDPHLIDDRVNCLSYAEIKRNQKRLRITITEAIEKTISTCIPIQSILENYINDIDYDSEEDREDPVPDVISEKGSSKEDSQEDAKEDVQEDVQEDAQEDTQEDAQEAQKEDYFMQEPNLYVSTGNDIEEASANHNQEEYSKTIKLNNLKNPPENYNEHLSNSSVSIKANDETKEYEEKDTPFFSDNEED